MSESFNAEIIAVGTELLLGDVVNTNAAYLSQSLANMGINVFYHATVGDNPQRLTQTLLSAMERSHLVVLTGGLGPTEDDLTIATLAQTIGEPMISDPESEAAMRAFYITRDTPMNKQNLKQALRPTSAQALPNSAGTAPGLFWDVSDWVQHAAEQGRLHLEKTGPKTVFVALPGVPREMTIMWTDQAIPRLRQTFPDQGRLYTKFLKFFGIGESVIAAELKDILALTNPTVSPYVGKSEVKLRIATKANNLEEAEHRMKPVEAAILEKMGTYFIGVDNETLEDTVANLLKTNGWSLSVAESCTGGLVSSRLTDVPGSSQFTHLNVVTYSNDAKMQILDVPASLLESAGAVSEEVAIAMAEGIRLKTQSDVGLSLTGIAGPDGGTPEKPVGLVYIGLSSRWLEKPLAKKALVNPTYGRLGIKHWFSQYALNLVRQHLLEQVPQKQSV